MKALLVLAICAAAAALSISALPVQARGTPADNAKSVRLANGKRYRIVKTQDADSPCKGRADEGFEEPISKDLRDLLRDAASFVGSAREAAKTSVTLAKLERFSSLAALLDTLPSDAQMQALNIGGGRDAGRVKLERRNVSVPARLIAFKKELGDHDYHLIIGATNADHKLQFFNAEVSGLPRLRRSKTLKLVRDSFESTLKDAIKSDGYTIFAEGIPMQIKGSLFFDTQHRIGAGGASAVGPGSCKPPTAWEIHPVTSLVFEAAN